MSASPAVTCIIIFLDEERFLGEAVDSVRAQAFDSWELLLVDDGSTDRSPEIARDYVRLDPGRVHYLQHPGRANLGMSASRNLGLAHARGTYVGFLDADDIWDPGKLAEQVRILEAHPDVGMVYGRTLLWHSWPSSGSSTPDHFCELGVEPDSIIEPPDLLVQLIENRYQTPTTCNALVRSSVVQRVGAFMPSFRGMFEDQVFFMKVALAERVFVSDRCWARYRQRSDSSSAMVETSGNVGAARLQLLAWLEEYLAEQDVTSPAVWRMLARHRRAVRWARLHARLKGWRRRPSDGTLG